MIAAKIFVTLYVAMQTFVVWHASPHHPVAYVIDVLTTLGALWIFWALWFSRTFRRNRFD